MALEDDGKRPRVALVGIHGYGSVHLTNLERLSDRVELVAVADPAPPTEQLPPGTSSFADLRMLLDAEESIDAVIISAPIHLHAPLTELALSAGADVLLEKPPFATASDFDAITELARERGRAVQIGFQSLGSLALPSFDDDAFSLGRIAAVSATGIWRRNEAYWRRSGWAGRRELNGVPVVDGAITNPFAHALATALRIAGARRASDVMGIELDQYRANPIDADDTSVVRLLTSRGVSITCAVTLCAEVERPPLVTVLAEDGDAEFSYTEDRVTTAGSEQRFGRVDLLENLLEHRSSGVELVSSLDDAGAFMSVLDRIRRSEPPTRIVANWHERDGSRFAVVPCVASIVELAARNHATFQELGAPWALPRTDRELARLRIGDAIVAVVTDGGGSAPTSSPRPYLDRLRTLAGTTVSVAHPVDHDWHLGVGVGLSDVNGVNFWGGRTYRRDRGYHWRNNHGRIHVVDSRLAGNVLEQELEWRRGDEIILREQRRLIWTRCDDLGWQLDFAFELGVGDAGTATLSSPGSKGRPGGGYGGFFWRLPECDSVAVRSPDAKGEQALHGSVSPWLAWSAVFDGRPATLAFRPGDAETAKDPWFVREQDYPAVGSAIAWDRPAEVSEALPLRRSFSVLVADGAVPDLDVQAWSVN